MATHRMQCGEVWGGFAEADLDLSSGGLAASLFSSSARGPGGGDIYYLSVCGQDLLTRIVLADVVGHGAAVTEVSRWLYGAVHSKVNDYEGARVLQELNQLAVERGIGSMATAALVSFAIVNAGATVARAGHAPVWIRRVEEGVWRPAEPDPVRSPNPNAPLGVLPGAVFDERFETLEPGDRMLLYTDGLVDARDEHGERFGEKRLLEVLDGEDRASLHELKHSLLQALEAHTPDAHDQDDVSLVAVEILPR